MRLPKLVYETYPYLYILGGVTTIIIERSTLAVTSGLTLIVAGALILLLRRNYRAIRHSLELRKTNLIHDL